MKDPEQSQPTYNPEGRQSFGHESPRGYESGQPTSAEAIHQSSSTGLESGLIDQVASSSHNPVTEAVKQRSITGLGIREGLTHQQAVHECVTRAEGISKNYGSNPYQSQQELHNLKQVFQSLGR